MIYKISKDRVGGMDYYPAVATGLLIYESEPHIYFTLYEGDSLLGEFDLIDIDMGGSRNPLACDKYDIEEVDPKELQVLTL